MAKDQKVVGNISIRRLTLVLQKNSKTVFTPVLKNMQPRGQIAPDTFKFILSPHFSKIFLNLPSSRG